MNENNNCFDVLIINALMVFVDLMCMQIKFRLRYVWDLIGVTEYNILVTYLSDLLCDHFQNILRNMKSTFVFLIVCAVSLAVGKYFMVYIYSKSE